MPNSLIMLDCSKNNILNLDNLPNSLKILFCSKNYISNLDNIPNSTKKLITNLTRIDYSYVLVNLKQIFCSKKLYNKLIKLKHIENKKNKIICHEK